MATTTNYDASSIKNLQFPESIRAKPSLYVGALGNDALFHLFKEAAENVVDEALGNHCDKCSIELGSDGSITVYDNGRGIPYGNTKISDQLRGGHSAIPTLKAVVAFTHTSGKFGSEAYEASRGTHGLGIKCNNALSLEFEVWTSHKANAQKWEYVRYECGVEKRYKLGVKPPASAATGKIPMNGTVVRWKPDLKLLGATKVSVASIAYWLQLAAYFTPGLTFTAVLPDGKKRSFHSENGPIDYLADQIAKLKVETLHPKVFVYRDALVDCVFQMTSADGCEVQAFTNGLNNPDKGNHFNSLFVALMASLTPYIKRGQEFGQQELRDGLVGLVNVKISSPKFSSQTKEKLVDERAGKPLQELLTTALKEFMAKNKTLATLLCERASELRKMKSKFTASKQVLNKLKHAQKIGMPAKASVSANCKPENRELFLLEGESAAGLCFRKGTKVLMSDGSTVNIEDLTVESTTLAFNGKDVVASRISAAFTPSREPVYELIEVCIEGETVQVTPEHTFLTTKGWVQAQDLTTEHVLVSGV